MAKMVAMLDALWSIGCWPTNAQPPDGHGNSAGPAELAAIIRQLRQDNYDQVTLRQEHGGEGHATAPLAARALAYIPRPSAPRQGRLVALPEAVQLCPCCGGPLPEAASATLLRPPP